MISEFDIELTGFETAEIDVIIERDQDPSSRTRRIRRRRRVPTCRRQLAWQIWLLGEHRVFCGDATKRHLSRTCSAAAKRKWSLRIHP